MTQGAGGPRRAYALDASVRRIENGRVLVGGSPLKMLRLTASGAALVDRLAAGDSVPAGSLVDRLLDGGAIHPAPASDLPGPFTPPDITAVIPTLATAVDGLVDRLGMVGRIVVVDDASTPAIDVRRRDDRDRAHVDVVRRPTNGGPAAARTDGLALVTTPLVLFVDADVRLPDDGRWLDVLLAHFVDDRVALVAPRVASEGGAGRSSAATNTAATMIAWYEQARAPLDLGGAPGPVRARTRVSYVPSAVWLARVDALRAVGGFDGELRTGEDVDLVWRLDERGWRARYEPSAVVHHAPRATTGAFVRQRFGYGASAGPLAVRHPGALAPVGVSAWSAAVWGLAMLGPAGVAAGAAVGMGSAAALARRFRHLSHPVAEAMRLAGRGHLYAGRQLAEAIARPWWPLAALASVASRRARRVVAVVLVVPAVVDWYRTRRAHQLDPARYLLLRLLDDGAYGLGVWRGALRAGTIAPLVPDLTSWPRPSRYEQRQRPAADR